MLLGGCVAKNELKMIIQRRPRRTRRVAYRLCARYWVLKQKLICTSVLSDISAIIKELLPLEETDMALLILNYASNHWLLVYFDMFRQR